MGVCSSSSSPQLSIYPIGKVDDAITVIGWFDKSRGVEMCAINLTELSTKLKNIESHRNNKTECYCLPDPDYANFQLESTYKQELMIDTVLPFKNLSKRACEDYTLHELVHQMKPGGLKGNAFVFYNASRFEKFKEGLEKMGIHTKYIAKSS
jgi:hypothetical protein